MMNHSDRFETERAQVVWNPLKSFNAQVLPRFVAQVAQVTCKPLFSLVPRFCPGMPPCPPYNPYTGGARLRAVRTRNEEGSDRALETRAGEPDVSDIADHQIGSGITLLQPRTLPLTPRSCQSFQLAQRFIRDVSSWGIISIFSRLVGHSSHSNRGLDDASDWLTKRSVRVPQQPGGAGQSPVTQNRSSTRGSDIIAPPRRHARRHT